MRKFRWLLAAFLILTLAVPVQAEDTLDTGTIAPSTESQPIHEHSWGDGEITTAPTCTQSGEKTYTCTCMETRTEEIPAAGHSWGSWQEVDARTHKRICGSCNTPEEAGHNLGTWQSNETAHYKRCSDCAFTASEDHIWNSSIVLQKPTCKEEGILGYVCSVCNLLKEEPISKLNVHTYDSACDPECNVCGNTRATEHDIEEVWVKDSAGHWYACTKCDEKIDYAKHTPGPEATEEKEQVCTTCKYVIAGKKKHTHSLNKTWSSDETGHWHDCKTCDAEQDFAAHTFDDICDIDCNVCDYKKASGHTYDDQWQTTKWEHWRICTVCGEESNHEKHIPGEEATEESAQVCTVCSYELEAKLIHSHDFEGNWEWDTENHWQVCKCGEISVEQPHIWDEGTEVRKNILEYNCTACGAQKMEKDEGGFPWTVLLVILALVCLGGIGVLVYLLRRGVFDEGQEEYEDLSEALLATPESGGEPQPEETEAEELSQDDLNDLLENLTLED